MPGETTPRHTENASRWSLNRRGRKCVGAAWIISRRPSFWKLPTKQARLFTGGNSLALVRINKLSDSSCQNKEGERENPDRALPAGRIEPGRSYQSGSGAGWAVKSSWQHTSQVSRATSTSRQIFIPCSSFWVNTNMQGERTHRSLCQTLGSSCTRGFMDDGWWDCADWM